MCESKLSKELSAEHAKLAQAELQELVLSEMRAPFGPRFFLAQLAAFVRDRCPEPAEHLPRVDLWIDGERVGICHVMAITPLWVAVAARGDEEDARMRTELIPYSSIGRVTIGRAVTGGRGAGFEQEHRPFVIGPHEMTPEEAIAAVAKSPAEG